MPTQQIPKLQARAQFNPATFDAEQRTVDVVFTTGAQVRRFSWTEWADIKEELDVSPEAMRMDRLNSGAPVLNSHDSCSLESVIGVVERAWLKGGEGYATIRFSEREDVAGIVADVRAGILRNISVGYIVHRYEVTKPAGEMPIYRAVDWEPMEISIVPIPADPAAQIRAATTFTATIEVRDMTDTVETPAPTEATETPVAQSVDLAQVRAQAEKAERERSMQIREAAKRAKLPEEFADGLIARGVPIHEAREAIIAEWSARTDKTATVSGERFEAGETEGEKHVRAASDWLLHRSGIKTDAKPVDMQGNPFAYRRLPEIARMCAERSGVRTDGMRDLEIVGRAFTQSGSDFPVILEAAINKSLLTAYRTIADSWKRFCKTGSVSDFRSYKRLRGGSIGNLDALTEMGEYQNKAIPDGKAETIALGTKGNLINISRQAIINDDLGYFMDLSQMLGRAAARTIESDVYSLLASNPTMSDGVSLFHANHGNLAASGAVNSVAAWDAARVAMGSQKDVSGNDYLDINPMIWLGPKSQGGLARVINDSVYDPDASNKLQKPNMVSGMVRDIVDTPRLSGNAWYLFADPQEAPVIEVVFLDGQQDPFLDNKDGWSQDGVEYKVRLDFGVGVIGYEGAYKNPGA